MSKILFFTFLKEFLRIFCGVNWKKPSKCNGNRDKMEKINNSAEKLKKFLAETGLSAVDVAEKIGVSHQTIYNLINKNNNIRKSTLKKIDLFLDEEIKNGKFLFDDLSKDHRKEINEVLSLPEIIEYYKSKIALDLGVKKDDVDIAIRF